MKEILNNYLKYNTIDHLIEKDIFESLNSFSKHDIFIYKFCFSDYYDLTQSLSTFLNAKETERANRFYKNIDKIKFTISRAFLKLLLSNHTKSKPDNIQLNYGNNKKPFLKSHPSLYFNLSHSNNIGVIAIAQKPLGIDIEFVHKPYNVLDSINTVFGEKEINFINHSSNKTESFFKLWTRKEALVKASGHGITSNFSKIPCLDGQHTIDSNMFRFDKNYLISNVTITEDYIAAVCYENDSEDINSLALFTFPETPNQVETLFSITL